MVIEVSVFELQLERFPREVSLMDSFSILDHFLSTRHGRAGKSQWITGFPTLAGCFDYVRLSECCADSTLSLMCSEMVNWGSWHSVADLNPPRRPLGVKGMLGLDSIFLFDVVVFS